MRITRPKGKENKRKVERGVDFPIADEVVMKKRKRDDGKKKCIQETQEGSDEENVWCSRAWEVRQNCKRWRPEVIL
jgi:hypothetical protein